MNAPRKLLSRLFPTLLAGSLLSLAVEVPAQGIHSAPIDAATRKRLEEEYAPTVPGIALSTSAELALVGGRYADAERLAKQALTYYTNPQYEAYRLPLHRILAEVYLRQKRYGLVLAEAKAAEENSDSGRLGLAKALAWIATGQRATAIQFFAEQYGTFENPLGMRPDWRLPMDDSLSDAALTASAYILRTCGGVEADSNECFLDLKAAERFAPRNPNVLVRLANYHVGKKQFEEARSYFGKAALLDEPTVRKLGQDGAARMDRTIAIRDGKAGI